MRVTLDSAGGEIQGWSFGVCHDPARAEVLAIAPGLTTDTVKSGAPADFNQVNEYTNGWTAGVVICFTACASLPPGIGYELFVASYRAVGNEAATSDLCFCNDLGSPPVNTTQGWP